MKRKAGILLFMAAVLLQPGAAETVRILYTGSFNGNLDGCECLAVPRSGLVSSAVFLRQRDPEGSVLVDLGDFMDSFPDDLLHRNFLAAMGDLSYDFLIPGDQEFIEGPDFPGWSGNSPAFLSGNLLIRGDYPARKAAVVVRRGIRIGLASLTGPEAFGSGPGDFPSGISLEAVPAAAEKLKALLVAEKADVKILLYHGGGEEARRLFGDTSWDAVLYAHGQELVSEVRGSRFIGSPGENGNRVGILSLTWEDGRLRSADNRFLLFRYREDPMDESLYRMIRLYRKEMSHRLKND